MERLRARDVPSRQRSGADHHGFGPRWSGHWVVSGVVRNRYGTTATSVAMAVTMYDRRGTVLDVAKARLGTTTLRAGRSTTYRARFLPTGLTPNVVYLRGVMRR